MRVPPASMAFTILLGFLVALPSFGIDMSLPALTAMGAALGVAPAQAGLMMSLFMLGFARRAFRLHALHHRRRWLCVCSIAANPPDLACCPGCGRRREHDHHPGYYP